MQPQRRSYSKSFKAQVIQECAQPSASIASIALSHSLNANLVHKWIRVQTQKSTALQPAFIPLPDHWRPAIGFMRQIDAMNSYRFRCANSIITTFI
ncbi:transposase [Pseudomonas sp. PGPR40]|uniref:transposase n=1 Tax=Pseudomonas sp. PGPR40 TaxID=2913476 RepID=UPI001EDA5805|nr:transposase [Pseudomonas sp. PGPR40]